MKNILAPFILQTSIEWWTRQETSFFLYFESELLDSVNEVQILHSKLNQRPSARLYYSVKSNPNKSIIRSLHNQNLFFDVSSLLELEALIQLGVNPARISYSGPNKSDLVLQKCFEFGIGKLHIDHWEEWNWITKQDLLQDRIQTPNKPGITIRIPIDNKQAHKLGLPSQDIVRLIKAASDLNFSLDGFHCYLGRESFSLEALTRLIEQCQFWINQSPNVFKSPEFYLGAGLPQLDLHKEQTSFLTNETLPTSFHSRLPIHFEVGRAISNRCGYYGARVLSVKMNRDEPIVIIDGGLQHLGSKLNSPRYGQLGFETLLIRDGEFHTPQNSIEYRIYGSLGVGHDLMMTLPLASDIRRGDWLLFSPCGAYGYTAASNQFLGLGPIKEYFLTTKFNLVEFECKNFYHHRWTAPQLLGELK